MAQVKQKETIYKSNVDGLVITMQSERRVLVEGELITTPGKYIEFRDGIYRTGDEKIKQFIESLEYFNERAYGVIVIKLEEEGEGEKGE